MIIPGAHRIELATGGLGVAVLDARRPDIGPVRPGYLLIPGASTLVPSPPIFDSVAAAGGYLTVDVHSPGDVDGYEIGVSTTILPPGTWWSTASGHLVQPLATGTYYLFARAHYQGAYSTWSQYGQLAPGQDEWTLTWADESVAGTVDTAYPYTTVQYGHTAGWQYGEAGTGATRAHQQTAYVDAFGLSTLPAGACGGAEGVRIDTVLSVSYYKPALAGVAWGFDLAALAAAPTATPYYGLAIRKTAAPAIYLDLYCVTDQTATLLQSYDATALCGVRDPGMYATHYVAVSVQARGNEVTVYAAGTAVIAATVTGITWSSALTGVGLWYQGSSNPGYSTTSYMDGGPEDYLRIYARDHTGEAETVTPGSPDHNDLDGRTATACHPASAVSVTPSGGIAATDVAAALAELDTEKQPKDADLTAIAALTGTGYPKRTADDTWAMSAAVVEKATSQTISLPDTMSTAEVLAAINAVPRYLPSGVNVVFQYAGNHTPTAAHVYRGFSGGGTLTIQGDTTETDATALHTSQNVTLDFSASSVNGLYVRNNSCQVIVQNLHVKVKGASSSTYRAFYLTQNAAQCHVRYNYAEGESASYGYGILLDATPGYVYYNYVNNLRGGIIAQNGCEVMCLSNDDTGTQPAYGLYAGGAVIRTNTTYPAGSTASKYSETGGDVRSTETVWTSDNDGAGSTLDADTLDGTHLTGVCLWAGALASAPAGAEGKIYYNTGDSKVYIYANGGWKALT